MGRGFHAGLGRGLRMSDVIAGLGVGGAELMLERLIDTHRSNLLYQHKVITLTGLGIVGERLRATGVEVVTVDMRPLLHFPAVLGQMVRLLRK